MKIIKFSNKSDSLRKTGLSRKSAGVLIATIVGISVLLAARQAKGETVPYFDFEDYAAALAAYVDDQGMVDYEALKTSRGRLDSLTSAIGALDPKVYDTWPDKEKIAF